MANIQDINLYGDEDSRGNPIEVYDEEALKTALTLWLTSNKGEFIKKPDLGGVIKLLLFKNLSESIIERVRFAIKNAITNYFEPKIILKAINIIPRYEQRYFEVEIKYVGVFNNQIETVSFFTRGQVDQSEFRYIDVPETEETLRNFVLVIKPQMQGKRLYFSHNENCWIWGKYKFINFNNGVKVIWEDDNDDNVIDPDELTPTPTDSYFEEIMTICNLQ
jgi:phage baseplate assembly protein W